MLSTIDSCSSIVPNHPFTSQVNPANPKVGKAPTYGSGCVVLGHSWGTLFSSIFVGQAPSYGASSHFLWG